MTESRLLAPDGVRYLPPLEPLLASLPSEQAEFLRELLRERAQTEALGEVARAVNGSLRLEEVLELTLRHTVALLGCDGAGIILERGDELEVVAWAMMGANVFLGLRYSVWDDRDPDEVASAIARLLGRGLAK